MLPDHIPLMVEKHDVVFGRLSGDLSLIKRSHILAVGRNVEVQNGAAEKEPPEMGGGLQVKEVDGGVGFDVCSWQGLV